MPDLVDQYLSGDCQPVRDRLVASISADSPPEQLAEAIEVADEFVRHFGDQIADGFRRGGFPVMSATERTLKTVGTLYGELNREYLSTRLPDSFEEV